MRSASAARSLDRALSDIPTRDRLPSLTGLRFWAALLVVLYHLTRTFGRVEPFGSLAFYGRTGVSFFFVLSGFVLAWTYLDRPTSYWVFLWRRFARLWPLVVVTGVLSLAAYGLIGTEVPWQHVVLTPTFLQAWDPGWSRGANPAAWTLSAEAFFYVTFPVILLVAAHQRSRPWLWAAIALLVPGLWAGFVIDGWLNWTLDYFPLVRVVQFALGVACGVMIRSGRRSPVGYWPAVVIAVGYHVALLPWHVLSRGMDPHLQPYSGSQWFAAPVFALLIMAAADRDRDGLKTGVKGAWSLRLGHWSYAWYLSHEIAIRLWQHFIPQAGFSGVVTAWVVLLPVTLGVAWVLYTWVEHPAEKWLRARYPGPA